MIAESDSILAEIRSDLGLEAEIYRPRRGRMEVPPERLLDVCRWAKGRGFEHLSSISVVDRLKDDLFDITYHLWSCRDGLLLTIKTSIDRDEARVESVVPIWFESAQVHERELHEAFGVEFVGNPDLSPLFLEDWEGPPPFRKDFDWRIYVRENLFDQEDEREKPYFE